MSLKFVQAPIGIVYEMLKLWPESAHKLTARGRLAYHLALVYQAPREVREMLLKVYTQHVT